MTGVFGWAGSLLRVDLTKGEMSTIDTLTYARDFVGGVGIASRIAWEEVLPGTGPFDPQNLLFFMVGPLTGTLASGAGRVEILGVAPQQRPSIFSRSGMGGHWGAELKYAGYDGIIVQGKADRPVYLWINNDQVEIRDAAELWGTGTYITTMILRKLHGADTRVVSCGQAGERLCRIAVVQTETGNAAGQGGYGAVMGSKNLKAIAVRGTRGVRIAKPQRFLELCIRASREGQRPNSLRIRSGLDERPGAQAASIGGSYRLRKCGFCITACTHEIVETVPAPGTRGVPSVARHCWSYVGTSPQADATARAMTSDYGLNGWEITYGMIPWLQMCAQHGLIDSIDGLQIPVPERPIGYLRDTAQWPLELIGALIQKIAFREDELGDALADGTCYAAHRLFGGEGAPLLDRIYPRRAGHTQHWCGHWGPGGTVYWPFWLTSLLQWCVDTRDPASDSIHQWAEHVLEYLPQHGPHRGPLAAEKVHAVCARVYGMADMCNPTITYDPPEARVIPAIWHTRRAMVVDSLVLCDYENTRVFSSLREDGAADTALMSKLLSACTGVSFVEKELDRIGERIWTQLRALDVRNFGRSRAVDESTIDGFMYPGKDDGVVVDRGQFLALLDKYYELSGWNPANGWPARAKLEELGLADVADELDRLAT